jgi:hypothetical protein
MRVFPSEQRFLLIRVLRRAICDFGTTDDVGSKQPNDLVDDE